MFINWIPVYDQISYSHWKLTTQTLLWSVLTARFNETHYVLRIQTTDKYEAKRETSEHNNNKKTHNREITNETRYIRNNHKEIRITHIAFRRCLYDVRCTMFGVCDCVRVRLFVCFNISCIQRSECVVVCVSVCMYSYEQAVTISLCCFEIWSRKKTPPVQH